MTAKCEEIHLSDDQARSVYEQLTIAELNDLAPNTIIIPGDEVSTETEAVVIDDSAAKAFLRQFEQPLRTTYGLLLFSCLTEGVKNQLAIINGGPYLQQFFAKLAAIDGIEGQSVEGYFKARSFTPEDIEKLIRIAKTIESTGGSSDIKEDHLTPFITALHYIIEQSDLANASTALENMPKEISYFERSQTIAAQIGEEKQKTEPVKRPLNVRDLACHLLSIIALNDYEIMLKEEFSPEQLHALPDIVFAPLHEKEKLIQGKIKSAYQPSTLPQKAAATYESSLTTVFYSEWGANPEHFFEEHGEIKGLPASTAIHELKHAEKKKPLLVKMNEAQAYFVQACYSVLKLGHDRDSVPMALPIPMDDKNNAIAFGNLQHFFGISLESFKNLFPEMVGSVDETACLLAMEIFEKVRSGKKVDIVDLKPIANIYERQNAILRFLGAIVALGDKELNDVKQYQRGQGIRMSVIRPTKKGKAFKMALVLPGDIDRLKNMNDAGMIVLRKIFETKPSLSTPRQIWSLMEAQIVWYPIFKYAKDPNFDAAKYFEETLIPFYEMPYTVVQ